MPITLANANVVVRDAHMYNLTNNNNINNVYPAPSIASNVNKSNNVTHDITNSKTLTNVKNQINDSDKNKSGAKITIASYNDDDNKIVEDSNDNK